MAMHAWLDKDSQRHTSPQNRIERIFIFVQLHRFELFLFIFQVCTTCKHTSSLVRKGTTQVTINVNDFLIASTLIGYIAETLPK